jgi:hypothetical protein
MTTTVLIGVQGNKNVKLSGPHGEVLLKPGRYTTLLIHGDQSIAVQEHGEFVDTEPATIPLPPPAAPVPAPAPSPTPDGGGGRPEE